MVTLTNLQSALLEESLLVLEFKFLGLEKNLDEVTTVDLFKFEMGKIVAKLLLEINPNQSRFLVRWSISTGSDAVYKNLTYFSIKACHITSTFMSIKQLCLRSSAMMTRLKHWNSMCLIMTSHLPIVFMACSTSQKVLFRNFQIQFYFTIIFLVFITNSIKMSLTNEFNRRSCDNNYYSICIVYCYDYCDLISLAQHRTFLLSRSVQTSCSHPLLLHLLAH